jgi:hypothetical protein
VDGSEDQPEELTTNRLTLNYSLRSMIQQWREDNPLWPFRLTVRSDA